MAKWDDWRRFGDDDEIYGYTGRPVSDGIDWVDPRRRVTKAQSPYGYDSFYIWRDNLDDSHAEYSDRLMQHDYSKWKEAWETVPANKPMAKFTRKDASKFLSTFYGKEIVATGLVEGCNISNGSPYWIFYFKDKK